MDKRVQFDFEIEFTNGGGMQGQGFRLDIAEDTISDQELVDYLVVFSSSPTWLCVGISKITLHCLPCGKPVLSSFGGFDPSLAGELS